MMFNGKMSCLVLIMAIVVPMEASKILIVAPFLGSSHTTVMQKIGLHLASKGHDVTAIVYNLAKDPPPNYKQIQVNVLPAFLEMVDLFGIINDSSWSQVIRQGWMSEAGLEPILSTPAIKDFIKNDRTDFDLVISENFYQESLYMFAHKYRVPLVLVGTTTFTTPSFEFMGVPISYNHMYYEVMMDFHEVGLVQTWNNVMLHMAASAIRRWYCLPKWNAVAEKHFGHLGPLPTIQELEKNVSLVLYNTHFSFDTVVPLVPGMVEVGGIHLGPNKPLEKDIKTFLDNAKHGVIYFALGSHLKSSEIPTDKMQSFVKVFSRVKQRIIWKWEDDNYPMASENILFRKWLPQFDILSHPNVKVFINHGGMLSIQEAMHNGVPMIGIPIFADQHRNIRKLKEKKLGVKLDYLTISEKTVQEALELVLNDEEYSRSAKAVSKIFRDRQNSPLDTVSYWVEYVIRHKDCRILKPPTVYMGFLDYYATEIVLMTMFLCVIMLMYIFFIVLNFVIKSFIRLTRKKSLKKKSA